MEGIGSQKACWQAPKLTELNVDKTLTGPVLLDNEALLNGQDQFVGGPKPGTEFRS